MKSIQPLSKQTWLLPIMMVIFTSMMIGCGASSGTIEGTVKVDGQPIQGVEVVFRNASNNREGSGVADAEGHYRIFYARGKRDFPVGDYRLQLGLMMPEEDAVSRRKLTTAIRAFNDALTTETIGSGKNVIDIDVTTSAK